MKLVYHSPQRKATLSVTSPEMGQSIERGVCGGWRKGKVGDTDEPCHGSDELNMPVPGITG
jgi:hypothetical protein